MNGYVKNKTPLWRHAMKREIGPGKTVSLDDLFEQYGEKHGLEKGAVFVEWLTQVKLRDNKVWEIVFNKAKKKAAGAKKEEDNKELVTPHVKKEMEPDEVTNFSVRTAREKLPKMVDIKLLKYALSSAEQLADKDTLCRMLRKRIGELEISRR